MAVKTLRTFAIMDYLKERKYCSITELRAHFEVSQATIHRDIANLVGRDLVQRVHGGVALVNNAPSREGRQYSSSQFQERINWNRPRKEAIAHLALKKVCDGDILYLDSSTTVSYLANLLMESNFSNLTIVTNSVTILQNFHKFPAHYVLISLGGSYDLQLNAFLGQAAMRELDQLSLSKAFISAFGINDRDATTNHEYHALLLSKVLRMSEHKYLLADRDKFNRSGLFKLLPVQAFDQIISD